MIRQIHTVPNTSIYPSKSLGSADISQMYCKTSKKRITNGIKIRILVFLHIYIYAEGIHKSSGQANLTRDFMARHFYSALRYRGMWNLKDSYVIATRRFRLYCQLVGFQIVAVSCFCPRRPEIAWCSREFPEWESCHTYTLPRPHQLR